jgi:hypothetical protein
MRFLASGFGRVDVLDVDSIVERADFESVESWTSLLLVLSLCI